MISPLPTLSVFIFSALSALPFFTFVAATNHGTVRAVAESKYTKPHSLGDTYNFDPRDGWHSVNVTNLQYKYPRSSSSSEAAFDSRGSSGVENMGGGSTQEPRSSNKRSIGDTIKGAVNDVLKGLKGIGSPEPVTITWFVYICLQTIWFVSSKLTHRPFL